MAEATETAEAAEADTGEGGDRTADATARTTADATGTTPAPVTGSVTEKPRKRGKTVHGEAANAGHRVLAPDDAEVEAYLETALNAPAPERSPDDRPSAGTQTTPGTVAVLDFGSQFAQLIARRVRELDVYSELLPHDTTLEELERRGTRAIILSGGPMSVYDPDAPRPDPAIWSGRHPRPRHLLRRADDGARARRGRAAGRQARIRSGQRHDHRPTTACSPASTGSSRCG